MGIKLSPRKHIDETIVGKSILSLNGNRIPEIKINLSRLARFNVDDEMERVYGGQNGTDTI